MLINKLIFFIFLFSGFLFISSFFFIIFYLFVFFFCKVTPNFSGFFCCFNCIGFPHFIFRDSYIYRVHMYIIYIYISIRISIIYQSYHIVLAYFIIYIINCWYNAVFTAKQKHNYAI